MECSAWEDAEKIAIYLSELYKLTELSEDQNMRALHDLYKAASTGSNPVPDNIVQALRKNPVPVEEARKIHGLMCNPKVLNQGAWMHYAGGENGYIVAILVNRDCCTVYLSDGRVETWE